MSCIHVVIVIVILSNMCLGCTDCIEERRPKKVYYIDFFLINRLVKLFNNKILKNNICSSLYISNSKMSIFIFPHDSNAVEYWSQLNNINYYHLDEIVSYTDVGYYCEQTTLTTNVIKIKKIDPSFKN